MPKHTETELKLTCADSSVWEKLMTAQVLTEMAVPGSETRQILDARYFDTPTYCLQKEKLAYRIRREGEQWVATVKGGGSSTGGLHERQEWNVVVSDPEPNIEVFYGTGIGDGLKELVGSQKLEPILITRFERRTLDVVMPDGSQIEVAADQGTIVAGPNTAPILEVELELKAGKPSALFTLGAALAREYPLLPEPDSKFYRGLILAGLVTPDTQKKTKLSQVHKDKLASGELRTVLVQLIAQFLAAQKTFLENYDQPEHVHELRICLRRLRSLLEFAGPLLAPDQHKGYQSELRELGQNLGVLREIDVAYASWSQYSDCQITPIGNQLSLGEVLSRKRQLEAEKIRKALYACIATPIVLDLWAILTDASWQQSNDDQMTLGEYTAHQLSRWLKAVSKLGKTIDWTAIENVHELRLRLTKIKYAVEVLQPVLCEASQLMSRMEILQNYLGLLHDAHRTDGLLTKLLTANSSKALHLEAGIVIGWQRRERQFWQKKMDKYWKKFYRTAQKWI